MRVVRISLALAAVAVATAFVGPRGLRNAPSTSFSRSTLLFDQQQQQPMTNTEIVSSSPVESALLGVALSSLFLPMQDALAGGSEYGILAGRTASMLHPVTMLMLFLTSIYSGYLGLQWRRLRGLSDEIKTLQQQAPRLASSNGLAKFPLSETMSEINAQIAQVASTDEGRLAVLRNDLALLRSASSMELESKISELSKTRKDLQGANLKDKHATSGSYLLGVGVLVSLLGAFNTYMRAGKLFPGPHLYAGMGCTALWAIAAALVPAMQKGNETARVAHIGLNVINVSLFAWQVVTGFDIMIKVWEKTSFP